jgi:hypothetical protein
MVCSRRNRRYPGPYSGRYLDPTDSLLFAIPCPVAFCTDLIRKPSNAATSILSRRCHFVWFSLLLPRWASGLVIDRG